MKQKYPRERVQLKTASPVEGLEQVKGVLQVQSTENGYDIRIADEASAQQLLSLAMSQTNVIKFEVKEPSMNEIFIKAVGGEKNE